MLTRRRPLSDNAVGRLITVCILAVGLTLWSRAEDQITQSIWLDLIGVVIVVFGFFLLFEASAALVGAVLSRTAIGYRRRLKRLRNKRIRRANQVSEVGPFLAPHAFGLFLAYVGGQVVVWGLVGARSVGEDGLVDTNRAEALAGLAIPSSIAVGALFALLVFLNQAKKFRASGRSLVRCIGFQQVSRQTLLSWTGIGLLLAIMMFGLSAAFPPRDVNALGVVARAAQTEGGQQLGWLIAVVLLAPPIEEILFRGALFEGIRRSWGLVPSAVIVTVLFLSMHLTAVWHYWPAFVGVLVAGVLLVVARIKTHSLGPPIAMHASYNLCLAFGVLLATAGS